MPKSRSGGESILARAGQKLELHPFPEEAMAVILPACPSSSLRGFHGTTAVPMPHNGCLELFMGPILLHHFRDSS